MIWPNAGVMGARAAAQPVCVRETGLRRNLLEDLALKVVYLNGEMTLRELAEHLHLSLAVADEVFQFLRKEQLCEVKGMAGGIYRFALTMQGRTRAAELLALSHYVGPAPVPLSDYAKRVREQSVQHLAIHAAQMKRAFEKLVLSDDVLYRLGTAITSGTSIFI